MTDVLREVGSIARALDSIANVEFKQYQLTRGQYTYLARICEHPGIIQGQLAELIRIDRTTTAHAVKRLIDGGLVYREPLPGNQKSKVLYPTEKGQAIYPILKRENDYSNQVALAGLSADDVATLKRILPVMSANVTADWQRVKAGEKRDY
ncbi:MarR family winged helix-turn-helix transcriptional regulator [Levilactobacillus brevis]|uniref:MarR family winged helix-turn-helix transcriptional regulator n=1 Tax=Levilactobacillus brevis TaxID=1580 RepID=UPI001C023571|nr:MarR family transcriptional regulator [Levilactobacillus brevis]MBT9676244.1 MarR family transcriptional regulator [Levilactobacillus brevis]